MNNILLNNFSFFENLALFGKLRRTALIRNCSNCEINSLVGVLCTVHNRFELRTLPHTNCESIRLQRFQQTRIHVHRDHVTIALNPKVDEQC